MRSRTTAFLSHWVAAPQLIQRRKKAKTGKAEGRKSYAEANPKVVELAHQLSEQRPRLSLRGISAAALAS
jgi:hypothetical protein